MKESKLVSAAKLMELAGFCGLDFCRIDNEHARRQDESVENVIRARRFQHFSRTTSVNRACKGDERFKNSSCGFQTPR